MTGRGARWLVSMMTAAFFVSGGCDTGDEAESACVLGTEGCPCNADGSCDPDLTCVGGSCEASSGTGGAGETGGAPGAAGAEAGSAGAAGATTGTGGGGGGGAGG